MYQKSTRINAHFGMSKCGRSQALIKMNAIKDCPVTVYDIILAEKIFGPDVASLKGKTV